MGCSSFFIPEVFSLPLLQIAQNKRDMAANRYRKAVKIALVSTGSILGLVMVAIVVILLLLTPARITPLVNRYATEYLNADVRFDTVDITWFEDFPMATLKLRNCTVISKVFAGTTDKPSGVDTLVTFSELSVAADVIELLNRNFKTRRIRVRELNANIYTDSVGRANYDIYNSTDTTQSPPFNIAIDRVAISGGSHIRYISRADSIATDIKFERTSLNGNLTTNLDEIRLSRLRIRNLEYTLQYKGEQVVEQHYDSIRIEDRPGSDSYGIELRSRTKLPAVDSMIRLNIRGNVGAAFADGCKMVDLDSLRIELNRTQLTIDGTLSLLANDSIASDMTIGISPLALAHLLPLLPAGSPLATIKSDITADIETRIKGKFTTDGELLPRVSASISIAGGRLRYEERRIEISDILFRAHGCFDPQRADSTGIEIDTVNIVSTAFNLNGRAEAWNLLSDPRVKGTLRGGVDLGVLSTLYPSDQGVAARGVIAFDCSGKFKLSELSLAKADKVDMRLKFTSDDLFAVIPSRGIEVMARGVNLSSGSNANKRDTIIAQGTRILRVSLRADTAHMRMTDGSVINLGGIRFSARSAASKYTNDTTAFPPFVGEIETRSLQFMDMDSSQMKLIEASALFSALPMPSSVKHPEINLKLKARRASIRDKVSRYSVSRVEMDTKAIPVLADISATIRRKARLDSLQQVYPDIRRDSLQRHAGKLRGPRAVKDDFSDIGDIDMKVDDKLSRLLAKWSVTGRMKAGGIRVITPYFPIASRLRNVDIDFTLSDITLRNTLFELGQSNLTVNGRISNLRRALAGRGELSVDVMVKADTLNMNEIITAANLGAKMMESETDFSTSGSEEQLQQMIDSAANQTMADELVIIPSNIKAQVRLDAKHVIYSTMNMSELVAELQLQQRCMQISYLLARTSSGDISLSGLYATRSRDNLTFGIDLDMSKMQVAKFIELVPELDTLYPMLRSLEGVVDCQMAATAALDTLMNIKLETLKGACHLNGKDMVLLDGETFSEISKMLKFKNRRRNMVDKVSLDILIQDSKIETFPFVLEMDRYKAAVSGIHNLDLSFNYHISVLKSPLPFRLGIDVFGTLDKFDYKIGRARYRNENVPTYVTLIESTRMNLSKNIAQIFMKGVSNESLDKLNVITYTADTVLQRSESLNAADSLLLYQSGMVELKPVADTVARDTTLHTIINKKRDRR